MTITAAIYVEQSDPVLNFAVDELKHFLKMAFDIEFVDQTKSTDWHFHLVIDDIMPRYQFSVDCRAGRSVYLAGHDATCVLHAMYNLLEKAGFCFEITGSRLTEAASLENLRDWSCQIEPVVQQRGIRQHINFPMDISSYPLDEAQEYIRNLARLRLNHITFHSYHNQWYAVDLPHGRDLAGAFFYDQRHDIPDYPVIQRVVRNQKTFCIPSIEPNYDNPEAKSAAAIVWLQSVIDEAKRVGLTVQFSFELREQNLENSLATVDAILKTYPQIDALEIITQETGGWGHAIPAVELRAIAAEYFGAEVLQDETIARYLVEGQIDLHQLLRELGHFIRVCDALKERDVKLPKLSLGIYCVMPQYHQLLLELMRRFIPEDIGLTFLLDHGNRAVARNLREMSTTPEDWSRSMIYSWIEFDGTMYLQQNALEGIRQLIALGKEINGSRPINGICLNHWRTAENRTCVRYAALSLLNGPINKDEFYQSYGQSLGVEHIPNYQTAMNLLDDADTQARDELPNVGFCYVGVWVQGGKGLGYFGKWEAEKLKAVRQKYETALENLQACAETTMDTEGLRYLKFLDNRVSCTIIYLRAVEKAVELQPICKDREPGDLSQQDWDKAGEICDKSLEMMDAYMELHAQAIVDRGCEGTLISFYYTPPAVIRHIRDEYTGVMVDDGSVSADNDAPPAPILWNED